MHLSCLMARFVRFLLESYTNTTLWDSFNIVLETLLLQAFQNLPLLNQVIMVQKPMVAEYLNS